MTHFRCLNCGHVFQHGNSPEAPPACPSCGLDPVAEPDLARYIQSLETIHFDPPHPIVRFKGKGHLACNPSVRVAGQRATGEPAVVNCPACRATETWKTAYGLAGEPVISPAHDEVIENDKATIG